MADTYVPGWTIPGQAASNSILARPHSLANVKVSFYFPTNKPPSYTRLTRTDRPADNDLKFDFEILTCTSSTPTPTEVSSMDLS